MSAYAFVDVEWRCPFCGASYDGGIQMKYGDVSEMPHYRIGDRVFFSGRPGETRLPNDSGQVRGSTVCNNTWMLRGFRFSQVHPWTPEKLEKFGCPGVMNIFIKIRANYIEGVSFPAGWEEILAD